MSTLVKPHGGGDLKPLLLEGDALAAEQARAAKLTRIKVSSREAGDIIMMGIGGFTPLNGFMTRADWEGVCDGMNMANGLFWPIPITLSTDESSAHGISEGDSIALADSDSDAILATMQRDRKVQHRQEARVHDGLQDHRRRAPGREDGHGPGRVSTWPARSRCCRREGSRKHTATSS